MPNTTSLYTKTFCCHILLVTVNTACGRSDCHTIGSATKCNNDGTLGNSETHWMHD